MHATTVAPSDDALLRYMVAMNEKVGVGKKERCSAVKFDNGSWKNDDFFLTMYCPRANTFSSGNAVLNELYSKKIAEKRAQKEAEKKQKQAELKRQEEAAEKAVAKK